MNRSSNGNNGRAPGKRTWLRRVHRWFGLAALVFVLLLSATGIALNHTSAWQLDDTYVDWPWLLAAYGIKAPPPSASFAAGKHRATLLGGRLYVEGRELARSVAALEGAVTAGEFTVVAAANEVYLLTSSGELVEQIHVGTMLPGPVTAVGVADERLVLRSGGDLFRFDELLVNAEPWPAGESDRVLWSAASLPAPDDLAALEDLYRGRGVTVERLLADLHSGRIFSRFGALFMDAIAVLLILLALTGLWMWLQRPNKS